VPSNFESVPRPVSKHLLTRQGDTILTLTPPGISNSNYVIMVSDWNCLKYFCGFLYCNNQMHRDLLIILYVFFYFILWPTNAQLFHKWSHCYMFRQHRVILRELVIDTLPRHTSISCTHHASTTVAPTYRLYIQPPQTDVIRTVATKWFYPIFGKWDNFNVLKIFITLRFQRL
jgi:hypothetical protein